MKKYIVLPALLRRAVILYIAVLLYVALHPIWSSPDDPKDIVVMVDISASMDPYFKDLARYFMDDIIRNVVRLGDNFHFLSFSSRSEIEISAEVSDKESLRKIILKVYGLKPLGLYTDLVAAVKFLTDYATSLSVGREKVILLLSDGIHDPSPTSPYFNVDREKVIEHLRSQARILKKQGWAVHILQMPMRDHADQEQKQPIDEDNVLGVIAQELGTDVVGYSEKEQVSEEMQIAVRKETTQAQQESEGGQQGSEGAQKGWDIPLYPILFFVLTLLVIFACVSLFRANTLKSKLERYMHPSHTYRTGFGLFRRRKKGRMIEMRVDQQNRHIGFKNINLLCPGQTLSVGGGTSRFLVFLVPFPPRIAGISFDGETYTFKPRRMELFPELEGPVEDCLDKPIPAQSGKGYSITIRFLRYVSPLEEINRILHRPQSESET